MKWWFRAAQAFGALLLIAAWAWRWRLHKDDCHLTVLLCVVTWAVATELGWHVGRSSKDL